MDTRKETRSVLPGLGSADFVTPDALLCMLWSTADTLSRVNARHSQRCAERAMLWHVRAVVPLSAANRALLSPMGQLYNSAIVQQMWASTIKTHARGGMSFKSKKAAYLICWLLQKTTQVWLSGCPFWAVGVCAVCNAQIGPEHLLQLSLANSPGRKRKGSYDPALSAVQAQLRTLGTNHMEMPSNSFPDNGISIDPSQQ